MLFFPRSEASGGGIASFVGWKIKECNQNLNALIINSISIPEDSINARALQLESAMIDVYTKMKPDSFKLQLQAVLTAYYYDIKGVQGASDCPKTKIVKLRFKDQENVGTTPDEACIEDAGSRCPPRQRRGACSCACGC